MNGKPRLAILGKGNKPRIVAVPEVLSYRLGDFIGLITWVILTSYFLLVDSAPGRILKQCAVKAGIDRRVYCHLLRHGGAIARLKRSGNPKSLQIHLGHSDIKMTMRYLSTLQLMESLEIEDKVKFLVSNDQARSRAETFIGGVKYIFLALSFMVSSPAAYERPRRY